MQESIVQPAGRKRPIAIPPYRCCFGTHYLLFQKRGKKRGTWPITWRYVGILCPRSNSSRRAWTKTKPQPRVQAARTGAEGRIRDSAMKSRRSGGMNWQ